MTVERATHSADRDLYERYGRLHPGVPHFERLEYLSELMQQSLAWPVSDGALWACHETLRRARERLAAQEEVLFTLSWRDHSQSATAACTTAANPDGTYTHTLTVRESEP